MVVAHDKSDEIHILNGLL